ncbi:MAG: hypothetical protein AAFR38_01670 [Planctomycetota bacterium]
MGTPIFEPETPPPAEPVRAKPTRRPVPMPPSAGFSMPGGQACRAPAIGGACTCVQTGAAQRAYSVRVGDAPVRSLACPICLALMKQQYPGQVYTSPISPRSAQRLARAMRPAQAG